MTDDTSLLDHDINIRVSAELRALLEEVAEDRGLSIAELVREYVAEQSRE